MLYYIFSQLADEHIAFNLFRYITFRSGLAFLTAFTITVVGGPYIIAWLHRMQGAEGQPIRDDGPETHFVKRGTPTMGGVLILLGIGVSALLWADLKNPYIWAVCISTFGLGALGFVDDYLKVVKKNTKGVSARAKILCQALVSLVAIYIVVLHAQPTHATHVAFPFFKDLLLDLGVFYYGFALVVIVGSSNAVNLTDGLDGLAIVPIMIAAACFALITYLVGNFVFAGYLNLHAVPGTGELAVFCCAIIGAGLGFLWYNAQPADVFMGDTGSLALGGSIGTIAVATKHELVLAIIGGLFVLEAVSVMLQVASYKLRGGKRIFLMAPIHHHFEKKGWSESKVVVRFWIIALICALVGLSTLKMR